MNKLQEYRLTPKGLATIAAIDSRLLPELKGVSWDDSKFNVFWARFENLLEEQGYLIFKVSKDRDD